jgi:hypothetical protein
MPSNYQVTDKTPKTNHLTGDDKNLRFLGVDAGISGSLNDQLTGRAGKKPFKRLTAGRSLRIGLHEAIIEARLFFSPGQKKVNFLNSRL